MTPEELKRKVIKLSKINNPFEKASASLQGYQNKQAYELGKQSGILASLSNPTDIGLCRWVEASKRMPVNMKAVFARDGIDMIVLFRQSDKWYSETNEEYFTDKEIEWLEEPIQ